MKKYILGFVAITIAAITILNLSEDHTFHQNAAGNSKTEKALAVLKDNDCMSCHSRSAALPLYAAVPGVGQVIKKDIISGGRHLNLDHTIQQMEKGAPVSVAVLNKIEKAITEGSMPVIQYRMIHLGSAIDETEKATILDWVAEARAKDYGQNTASETFKNEPVRPISNFPAVNDEKVALGKALYHDTRLSADNTVSCASCHDLNRGGVDRLPVSVGIKGQKGPINAPTVFNAAYNLAQFWDGRAHDLQAQAAGPPLADKEMGNTSFDQIVEKLNADAEFKQQMEEIYPSGISQETITDAIATFEKTLITPNAPFDQYLKGNTAAISEQAIKGYQAFKKAGCATCHAGEALGGRSFEYVGLTGDYFTDRGNVNKVDHGYANFTKDEKDTHYFKVPTLRNVAQTAPYFHDASAKTLKEAIEMMNTYQSKGALNAEEIDQVEAFLKTLTGEYNGKAVQ
ncbi:cytochrome c peroxidase [Persicobacter psychrovividus]|uniref:Cytochrome-c peroxidase n=1 Tax=Persicobacter psychrovividus TaxID=387638 RepID=A0ABM7VIM1_9BACT|nr:cytochrome-c peroxidase [Persicobacter psychrovividus]